MNALANAPDLATPAGWLPLAFLALMGLAILAYVVLDGFDLGVGILLRGAEPEQQDLMVASIGPFWDANETWLVLGVGILLVAFPLAHGMILGALYLPVTLMLVGLVLRGVAFDFRVKARVEHKHAWNLAFHGGSVLASAAQGTMLGLAIVGFDTGSPFTLAFALAIGLCLPAGYALLGATWLIMKTEGDLQRRAIRWARTSLGLTALGIVAVSLATPVVSPRIFDLWFSLPNMLALAPIPVLTGLLFVLLAWALKRLPLPGDHGAWVPFALAVAVFVLAFLGLAFSLFPYLVVDRVTVWDAASAPESLMIVFVGACVVLPMIVGYTAFAYRVFWGKAQPLSYG
jgi:cytochrome d ubiquinol oxidase subunit II